MLDPSEAKDLRIPPPWLRVWWRKAHPELTYDMSDPTGGYPLVLKEIWEWMLHHQDLQPGEAEPDKAQQVDTSLFIEPEPKVTPIRKRKSA